MGAEDRRRLADWVVIRRGGLFVYPSPLYIPISPCSRHPRQAVSPKPRFQVRVGYTASEPGELPCMNSLCLVCICKDVKAQRCRQAV